MLDCIGPVLNATHDCDAILDKQPKQNRNLLSSGPFTVFFPIIRRVKCSSRLGTGSVKKLGLYASACNGERHTLVYAGSSPCFAPCGGVAVNPCRLNKRTLEYLRKPFC